MDDLVIVSYLYDNLNDEAHLFVVIIIIIIIIIVIIECYWLS
jgi:hypothetical protein